MTTIVHVLGCHLQAKRLNGDDWEKIVWANGTLAGRLVQGLATACRRKATLLSFGTGASVKDGVKESQYTLNFAYNKFRELGLTLSREQFIESLLDDALVDTETQNTTQEIEKVFQKAVSLNVDEVVFVTSAFHAGRAITELGKVLQNLPSYENSPLCSVVPSFDDPGDTLIMEEPHRGDLIQENFAPVLRKVFKFLKYPELSQGIREKFEYVIEEHEKKL